MSSFLNKRILVVVALAIAGLIGAPLVGCTPATNPVACTSSAGDRVVVLVSANANEPRPQLTDGALRLLRQTAERRNATDGAGGIDNAAILTSMDGRRRQTSPLTPRRPNCAVEHGTQRDALISANVDAVRRAVQDFTGHTSRSDLLEGIDTATAGATPGTLVILASGLSTAGGFDLRQVGWSAAPRPIAAELASRRLLPDLTGWRVYWIGLGDTAGKQRALPLPVRDTLHAYWSAICSSMHARCTFDETRLSSSPARGAVPVPAVDVPEVTSIPGPRGVITTTVPYSLLGFGPDSANLSPEAMKLIRSTAAAIRTALRGHPENHVTVTGYAADPPDSTVQDRQELAERRARAVADALVTSGVTNMVRPVGVGTRRGHTAMRNGVFVESLAESMRKVEIKYQTTNR